MHISRRTRHGAHLSTNLCLPVLLASLATVSCSDLPMEPERTADEVAVVSQAVRELAYAARPGCSYGTFPEGAAVEVCFPDIWNGGVVFYAHGYVAAGEPLEVPDDELGGLSVADIVRGLGYVYAAPSYRDNGLVAADAVTDLEQLGELVQAAHPALAAAPAYLVGVSEGGLATALAMQNPYSPFAGGLALCGPVGSFQGQSNYFGDFRLIFDYFFPGVLPARPLTPQISLLYKAVGKAPGSRPSRLRSPATWRPEPSAPNNSYWSRGRPMIRRTWARRSPMSSGTRSSPPPTRYSSSGAWYSTILLDRMSGLRTMFN